MARLPPEAPGPSGLTLACRRVPLGPHPCPGAVPSERSLGARVGSPQPPGCTSNLCMPRPPALLGGPSFTRLPRLCHQEALGHWPGPQALGVGWGLRRGSEALSGCSPVNRGVVGTPLGRRREPERQGRRGGGTWSSSGGISDRAQAPQPPTPNPLIIPPESGFWMGARAPRGAGRSLEPLWAPASLFLSPRGSWRWAEAEGGGWRPRSAKQAPWARARPSHTLGRGRGTHWVCVTPGHKLIRSSVRPRPRTQMSGTPLSARR